MAMTASGRAYQLRHYLSNRNGHRVNRKTKVETPPPQTIEEVRDLLFGTPAPTPDVPVTDKAVFYIPPELRRYIHADNGI